MEPQKFWHQPQEILRLSTLQRKQVKNIETTTKKPVFSHPCLFFFHSKLVEIQPANTPSIDLIVGHFTSRTSKLVSFHPVKPTIQNIINPSELGVMFTNQSQFSLYICWGSIHTSSWMSLPHRYCWSYPPMYLKSSKI